MRQKIYYQCFNISMQITDEFHFFSLMFEAVTFLCMVRDQVEERSTYFHLNGSTLMVSLQDPRRMLLEI